MNDAALEQLLELVYREHHHDFRCYARPSIRRGVARAMTALGCPTVGHLHDRIERDGGAFGRLLEELTVQVSELFRDPAYFRALREEVVPRLATYASPKVWVAGCGTGEEAYSIAILLREAGLLDRSLVYATDIDPGSLAVAEAGAYAPTRVEASEERYLGSGGAGSLSDHFVSSGPRAVADPALRRRVVVSEHSLATDTVFAEVHLVSCRNVLIYFDRGLRESALALLGESLCPRGFLGLGADETLGGSAHEAAYEPFDRGARIYRRSR